MSGGPRGEPLADGQQADRAAGDRATGRGPGRLIVTVYGVLAIAATARSAVQIIRDLDEAPLAYLLSGVAAVVYVVATVALARGGGWRPVAWATVATEMVGVLAVGALSVFRPELFAEATVWSGFGQGYGYVPLVLPVIGLWWLARTRPPTHPPTQPRTPAPEGSPAR